ncbi:MAG TPA: glycoside hydrolase domain-containing protein [Verrucomicrobiae bacterium]|nr:glycoside hydrolase domain-containing protein [Verrucomicrobiae bacterium]
MNSRFQNALAFAFLAAGLAKLNAAVPPKPFTPVKATSKEFSCLGRKTALGNFLLPAQITATGKSLLAGPVRFFSQPDIFSEMKCGAKVVEQNRDSARWEWQGESTDFSFKGKMTADCDGFCWYEIQLAPKHPVKLRSLGLEIPRVAKTARYLHTASYNWSNVSQGLPELGGNWSGAFSPYVWLGDEERGLAWCAESDEGWHLREPARALSVKTQGELVSFKATFLDHEELLDSPVIFRFGLQSSPVKPVSFAWRAKARILHDIHYESCRPGPDGRCELDALRDGGVKTVVIHDSWTRYYGQMLPADANQFRELIDACHKRGLRLLVYVGYGIARTAPELQGKHDEWSVLPLIPWDPGYKPEFRGFDATCANSGWADWLVAGTEKLFTDFDLDGLYFDGTSEAWVCHNAAHGCGWKDSQGGIHPVYPVLAARKLMRRVADAVHRHKPDGILDVHMSSSFTLPTLAFCDSVWNGEQFEGHSAAENFEVPLSYFRTEFMGYAHGLDAEFLCYEKRPFTFDEAIALAWVHGVEVRPYPQSLSKVTPIWRAMDRFDVSKAHWHPYWLEPVASAGSDAIKISAWTRNGKALLFVSHLKRRSATVHVQLDPRKLGFKEFNAKDALTESSLAVNDGTIELTFNGMNYRILEITRR